MIRKVSSVTLDQPIRADHEYTFSLTKAVFNMRVGMLFLTLLCLGMGVLVFTSMRQPRLVAVIDSATGKTYGSVATPTLTFSLLERQLIYYSREFCEAYLAYDHVTIKSARQTAKALMHPTLLAPSLPKDYLEDKDVLAAVKSQATSNFEWTIRPRVTAAADPKYTVFCQFTRTIKRYGFEDQVKTFNVKLDWGRLRNDQDAFNRPHALTLLKFEELAVNSPELTTQLNLIK